MNAPVKPQTDAQHRQSLESKWQDARQDLLQLYAELEIVLGRQLLPARTNLATTPPAVRTFGQKLQSAVKQFPGFKDFSELVPLRNLLAHSHAQAMVSGEEMVLVLRVADVSLAMNARIIPEGDLKPMCQEWAKRLKFALAAARELSAKAKSS